MLNIVSFDVWAETCTKIVLPNKKPCDLRQWFTFLLLGKGWNVYSYHHVKTQSRSNSRCKSSQNLWNQNHPHNRTAAEPNNYTTCKFHLKKFSHQPKIYFGSINRKWSFVCENAIAYPSKARKQLNALHASVNNDLNHFTLPFFLIHVNIDLLLWSKEEKKPSLQLQ